ncbi:hypothetical protein ACQEVZ_55805 [Dactylosporangium sp. CA-152071]|uniref:hypothetical protein n=1 Tax=Dactylosporangium sp. CA-152071 TaxID=3239933 RepID=UPI003D9282A9
MADQPAADNGAAALTARYEQLRQVALTGNAEGWRHGLGVLATRGMTGWMHTCRTIPPPPAAPRCGTANPIAVDAAAEIVAVMAAMALAHL